MFIYFSRYSNKCKDAHDDLVINTVGDVYLKTYSEGTFVLKGSKDNDCCKCINFVKYNK